MAAQVAAPVAGTVHSGAAQLVDHQGRTNRNSGGAVVTLTGVRVVAFLRPGRWRVTAAVTVPAPVRWWVPAGRTGARGRRVSCQSWRAFLFVQVVRLGRRRGGVTPSVVRPHQVVRDSALCADHPTHGGKRCGLRVSPPTSRATAETRTGFELLSGPGGVACGEGPPPLPLGCVSQTRTVGGRPRPRCVWSSASSTTAANDRPKFSDSRSAQ